MAPREPMHRYYLDHRENLFYIRTNKYGHNFALATAPDDDPSMKNWKPIVPHREDVTIVGIDLFKDFRSRGAKDPNALTNIRIYNFQTSQWSSIPFPEPITTPRAQAAQQTSTPKRFAISIRASSRRTASSTMTSNPANRRC